MAEKTRYTDEELAEFKQIILDKLELARRDYQQMMDTLTNRSGNDVDDTMPTYKVLEEGSMTQTRKNLQRWLHASKSLSKVCKLHSSALKIRLMVSAALQANSYLRNVYAQYPTPL